MFIIATWIFSMGLALAYSRLCTDDATTSRRKKNLILWAGAVALGLLATLMGGDFCAWLSWDSCATFLHYTAYFGFGVIVFGGFFAIPVLALGFILRSRLRRVGKRLSYPIIGALVLVPFFSGALASGYGLWEGRALRIKHITFSSPKIPQSQKRIRLAVFADLHLENPVRYGLLEEMVKKIIAQEPDVILALGDIVVGPISNLERVTKLLAELKAPLGKYFIYGNHEMYTHRNQSIEVLHRSEFRALVNQGVTTGMINLIGLTDAGEDDFDAMKLPPLINNGLFTILMEHRPLVPPKNLPLFDLQLSGHTHGGQIWPLTYLIKTRYPYLNGLYKIGKQKWIYTSPGVGTYGPPMRISAQPEITVIDLVPG